MRQDHIKPSRLTARKLIGRRPWDTVPEDTTEAVKKERESMRVSHENSPYKRFLAELDGRQAKRFGRA